MKPFLPTLAIAITAMFQPMVAVAQESLGIGYFSEWPLPAHYGQNSGAYDEVLSTTTRWQSFDSSNAMFGALETGEIQIALSQGVVPFLMVATEGLDFDIIDIAVSYADSENCFAHEAVGFSASNASALVGKTVALPIGTTAHFNFLRQLSHLDVNPASLQLVNMAPAQAAIALEQRKVDIACGWGPALENMKRVGQPLTSGDEKIAIGGGNFDVIAIRGSFGADNPEIVASFLKVTNDLNASFTASPARMIESIALSANMTEGAAFSTMSGFKFPTKETKLGADWLGGGVQDYLTAAADFFVQQGTMNLASPNYSDSVDTSYLKAASEMPLVPAQ